MEYRISTEKFFDFVREWIGEATATKSTGTQPHFHGLEQLWAPTLRNPRSQWLPMALRDNTELCERLKTLVEARGCIFQQDVEGTIYIYIPA